MTVLLNTEHCHAGGHACALMLVTIIMFAANAIRIAVLVHFEIFMLTCGIFPGSILHLIKKLKNKWKQKNEAAVMNCNPVMMGMP